MDGQRRALMARCSLIRRRCPLLSLALLVVGILLWIPLACSCNRDSRDHPPPPGSSSITLLKEKLEQYELGIKAANSAGEEARAILGMMTWFEDFRRQSTSPTDGTKLNYVLTVTEKATGRNVTSNPEGSLGEVTAKILFQQVGGGKYQVVYTMEFTPKDRASLAPLYNE